MNGFQQGSAADSLPLQIQGISGRKRMPLSRYFKGKGQKVISNMKDQYGDKKGEQVFYATANKNPDIKPAEERPKKKSFGQRIAQREG